MTMIPGEFEPYHDVYTGDIPQQALPPAEEQRPEAVVSTHEGDIRDTVLIAALSVTAGYASYEGIKDWVFGSGKLGVAEMLGGLALAVRAKIISNRSW